MTILPSYQSHSLMGGEIFAVYTPGKDGLVIENYSKKFNYGAITEFPWMTITLNHMMNVDQIFTEKTNHFICV